MLYKVTPMLTPEKKPAKQPKDPNAPKEPRKRRKSAVYDADGNEVLITMMCLKCRAMKPLAMFGLRKMADGAIRNQPWCRTCRSGASTRKKKGDELPVEGEAQVALEAPLVAEPPPAVAAGEALADSAEVSHEVGEAEEADEPAAPVTPEQLPLP